MSRESVRQNMINSITVCMSKVAAFCNRHKYQHQDCAFVDILDYNIDIKQRIEAILDKEDLVFQPIVHQLDIELKDGETATEVVQRICSNHEEKWEQVTEIVRNAKSPTQTDINQLRTKRARTEDVINEAKAKIHREDSFKKVVVSSVIEEKQKSNVDKAIAKISTDISALPAPQETIQSALRKDWLCERGKVLEGGTIQRLKSMVFGNKDVKFVEQKPVRLQTSMSSKMVNMPGKIDLFAIDDQSNIVFEIKNRQNRFFTPSYDLDQLCLYIVASCASLGYLVEQCNNKLQISYTMTQEEAADRYRNQILPDLLKASTKFLEAVENPRQKEYASIWNILRLNVA